MTELTDKQQAVLDYIIDYRNANHFPPTIREIAEGFGLATKSAYDHISALKRKGKITWIQGQARTLKVLD